jgi:hypothetical protein
MKRHFLTIFICFFLNYLNAQDTWSTLPQNPAINNLIYDIEMFDGKVYQIYSQNVNGTNKLIVDYYNPQDMLWVNLTSVNLALLNKIKTEKIEDIIYITGYNGNNFYFYKLNTSTQNLTQLTSPYQFVGANSNWEFHTGKNANELYIMFTSGTGPSDVNGLEYNPGLNSWNSNNENTSTDLSTAELQIQSSDQFVYFGLASNDLKITYFQKGSIILMNPYDNVNGNVLSNSTNWDNHGFVLTGNRNDHIALFSTEDSNNKTYENAIINGTQIDVNLSSPNTTFNLDVNNIAKESTPSHGFIMSNFSANGLGNPNENFQVIKKDYIQGGSWEEISTDLILPQGTLLDSNSLKMSVNNDYHHIAVAYKKSSDTANEIKVSNSQAYLLAGSSIPNSGLCAGQMNILYGNVQLMDDNYDQVRILNVMSLNSETTNLTFYPDGYDNGVSKFKILGIPSSNNDQIVVNYTDGYGIFSLTLDVYSGNTEPIDIQFVADPIKFCNNVVQLDLSEYVNYYDQGIFRINGQNIFNSQINVSELNEITPTGTIKLIQNVNGCIIIKTTSYVIVDAPTVSTSTTPSSCVEGSGTATAVVTPGSSSSFTKYWSTGQTNLTINNLNPGGYYFFINDGNNCKATALASIISNDISISGTITHPSCYGAEDGGIEISVNGTTDYQVVWSNGQFSQNLTNIGANSYECTLFDASGCQINKTYQLIEPSKVEMSFTITEPDCNLSNGKIFTTLSGGEAPYTKSWSSGQSTSNITGLNSGFYTLNVTDNNNCVFNETIFLNNINPIVISDSIVNSSCSIANGSIDLTIETTPVSGQINSIIWNNGSSSADIFNLSAGEYLVSVNYGDNCLFQKLYQVGIKPPLKTNICVVTVDEETTTNLIVWEKPETTEIAYFKIYRENILAGNFMFIDTVNYENLSVFNDVVASPLQRSWRYRISAVNGCGIESALSTIHKTLHLNTIEQVTPGTFDIYWDEYEGINIGNYIVNRFTAENGWEELSPAVPFGNETVFTDSPPIGSTNVDYLVSFELLDPCTATWRTENFNVSRSNKDKGIFNPGEGTGNSNNAIIKEINSSSSLTIYPNPFQNEIFVQLTGVTETKINIINPQGQIVKSQVCSAGNTLISTEALTNGIYFVSFNINHTNKIYKIIKSF